MDLQARLDQFREESCPECGVRIGNYHRPGCEIERCAFCGELLLACGHGHYRIDRRSGAMVKNEHPIPLDDREPYAGYWWCVRETIQANLWSRYVRGTWRQCAEDHPKAQPDLARFLKLHRWSRRAKRYVKRTSKASGPRASS